MPESTPQYFEQSGTDPGLQVPSQMPEPPSRSQQKGSPELSEAAAMTMVEHLAEMRSRLMICLGALVVGFAVGFGYALPLIELLKGMAPAGLVFVQLSPGEVLMSSFRLSLYTALALASPVIVYNVLRFTLPGLLPRERALLIWAVLGGALLFAAGVVFAYFFVVPPALEFLTGYGQTVAENQISIQSYIAFCSALMLIGGGMFELPMVLFLLSLSGLLRSEQLIRQWRWAVISIFTVAAIVTPGQDPFSMLMIGSAMTVLYGLSILPIRLLGR